MMAIVNKSNGEAQPSSSKGSSKPSQQQGFDKPITPSHVSYHSGKFSTTRTNDS